MPQARRPPLLLTLLLLLLAAAQVSADGADAAANDSGSTTTSEEGDGGALGDAIFCAGDDGACAQACLLALGEEGVGPAAAAGACGSSRCSSRFARCECLASGSSGDSENEDGAASALLVLRLDGACVSVPPAVVAFPSNSSSDDGALAGDIDGSGEACGPRLSALFNMAALASPEIPPEALYGAAAPADLVALLRTASAAAVGLPSANVSVGKVRLEPPDGSAGGLDAAAGGLLLFDLSFQLCAAGGRRLEASDDPGAFEVAFRFEAQRYAAFHWMTLRLVRLVALDPPEEDSDGDFPRPSQLLPGATDGGLAGLEDSLAADLVIIVFCGVGTCMSLSLFALVLYWTRKRRSKEEVQVFPIDEELGVDGQGDHAAAGEGEGGEGGEVDGGASGLGAVLAHVACAFSPDDVEDDKVFRDCCLEINEGDIIEVIAGGGGWLFGRLLGAADGVERVGYFPENRASWIGKISAEGLVTGAERHLLVAVESGFDPGQDLLHDDDREPPPLQPPEDSFATITLSDGVRAGIATGGGEGSGADGGGEAADEGAGDKGGDGGHEHMLQLGAGELVEVLAGAGGWLYGHVVGSPERRGYFPQSYATRLGACASENDAARTDQGLLVRVDCAFTAERSDAGKGDASKGEQAEGDQGQEQEAQVSQASFSECCLSLAEGDVVEVVASGGGWLYGRVVGDPQRAGYFPETRVSWLGRPVAELSAPSAGVAGPPLDFSEEPGSDGPSSAQVEALRAAAHAALGGGGAGEVPPAQPAYEADSPTSATLTQ